MRTDEMIVARGFVAVIVLWMQLLKMKTTVDLVTLVMTAEEMLM